MVKDRQLSRPYISIPLVVHLCLNALFQQETGSSLLRPLISQNFQQKKIFRAASIEVRIFFAGHCAFKVFKNRSVKVRIIKKQSKLGFNTNLKANFCYRHSSFRFNSYCKRKRILLAAMWCSINFPAAGNKINLFKVLLALPYAYLIAGRKFQKFSRKYLVSHLSQSIP